MTQLQWRHNWRDGVPNHRRLHCLINCWSRRRAKKTSKPASLGFGREIHRWPVNSRTKGQCRGAYLHLKTSSCERSFYYLINGVTVSIDSVNHINSTMKALVIPTGHIAKVCDPKPNIHISWCARVFRKSAMWLINILWNRPCTTKVTSRLESSTQGPWENRHHSKQGIQIDASWCRIKRVISKLQVNIAENDFVVIYFVEVLISAHN